VLREWQGLPYQAIAAELDVSVEAATALVVRARNNLSRQLERPSAVRRGLGTAGTWLLAPLERLASGGLAIKTAAGVATVVGIGIPATSVIHTHPSSTSAGARQRPVAAQTGGHSKTATAARGGQFTSFLTAAPMRAARRAGGVSVRPAYAPDTSDPGPSAAPDPAEVAEPAPPADATPADSPPAQGEAAAQSVGPVEAAPAAADVATAPPAATEVASDAAGDTSPPSDDHPSNRHPTTRPTLPPQAHGTPPADPGKPAIPHTGDDITAS